MRVAVDTGGTFTDFVARTSQGEDRFLKRPSTPEDPAQAILSGLAELETLTGETATRLDHGTTVATNALLEGTTSTTLLVVNKGFEDLLLLGRQNRDELFALEPSPRPLLLPRHQVLGIGGRLGPSGEELEALEALDLWIETHRSALIATDAVAICLLHSCSDARHEEAIAEALKQEMPELFISCSHRIASIPREYERAQATVANALVQPLMARYLGRLRAARPDLTIRIMASDGGLMDLAQAQTFPGRTLLSGPAGGLVGAWAAAEGIDRRALLSLDMGGTSTDVAAGLGLPACAQQGGIGPHRIAQDMLPVETVGAGGGSIAWIDADGLLQVGPQSAGADPGPVAYGRGGRQATVTDANVVLGRLPSLLDGGMMMDEEGARKAIANLAQALGQSTQSTARAILAQAEARMARACRRVTVSRGIDPGDLCLVAFGGAGGLHAASICEEIGCQEFMVPAGAGLLSARGILHASPQIRRKKPWLGPIDNDSLQQMEAILEGLQEQAESELMPPITGRLWCLRLRYRGQGSSLQIPWQPGETKRSLQARFAAAHEEGFGFRQDDGEIEVVQLEAVATGASLAMDGSGAPIQRIEGPQVLAGMDRTVWLPEGWSAEIYGDQTLRCFRPATVDRPSTEASLPLALEIHHQRLSAIAEEMGERLRRSARSTNIKERRDYSCAVFDRQGQMLAHAAHIPVHLGATPASVHAAFDSGTLQPGAEVLVNDPYAGGSHLPDLCLVSSAPEPAAILVANRAHHADVGGITPGSLPSSVTPEGYRVLRIDDEGLRLPPTRFDTACVERVATASRSPWERRGDLQAQQAANAAGLAGMLRLHDGLGTDRFDELSGALLDLGEARMARCIQGIPDGIYCFEDFLDDDGLGGGPLAIPVRIEVEGSRAVVDFRTAPDQVGSPINAARAVTESAVLYVFCCLAEGTMPANAGMLRPIRILTRPGSILHPTEPAPVSAGNVETSQRIVDSLFGALAQALPRQIPAASGGSMSNLLFGAPDGSFVHYETLACGAGAGPSGPGADGIQTHMTNTLNTPIERLEQSFPVRVEAYKVAPAGTGNGGRGVIRVLRFLEPVVLSLSGERRHLEPWGLHGGPAGRRGRQTLILPDGSETSLPGKISLPLAAGSILELESPGGGAWQDWSSSQVLAMSTAPENIDDRGTDRA